MDKNFKMILNSKVNFYGISNSKQEINFKNGKI